jgi:hypothetical protein
MAYIGNDVDAIFLPSSVNTSTDLRINGGALTQTGGDVNLDGGTFFLDESANRVGIGTTTPTATLDVAGAIKATEWIGIPTSLTVLTRDTQTGVVVQAPSATLTVLNRSGGEVAVTF